MDTYTISNDIKGSRRPFFRDEYEEWIEHACSHRTSEELYESRYEKMQREFEETLNEDENFVDTRTIDMIE
jgi:hypothetical protein